MEHKFKVTVINSLGSIVSINSLQQYRGSEENHTSISRLLHLHLVLNPFTPVQVNSQTGLCCFIHFIYIIYVIQII